MSTSEREAALRKIQKCLNLGKSSNANEAAAALRQAQAMMQKHGVTEDDILAQTVTDDLVKTREGFGRCAFLSALANLMRSAFGVDWIMEPNPGSASRANIRYVGPEGRAKMAGWAHRVITRATEEAWQESLRDFPQYKGDAGKRTAFRLGWLSQVRGKVEAIGFTEDEARAVKTWMATFYGRELGTIKPKANKLSGEQLLLARLGQRAAADFELHRPMGADPSAPAIRQIGHG